MTAGIRHDLASMEDGALEAALLDLAGALAVPPVPDVAAAVGARLRATPRPLVAPARTARVRPRLRWALLAAALALILLAAIAAGGGFGLPGLRIFFETPSPTPAPTASSVSGPSPSASPGSSSTGGLVPGTPSRPPAPRPTLAPIGGRLTNVADAQREVAFHIVAPDPALVGQPSLVYLDSEVTGGEVVLVFVVADAVGLPPMPLSPDGKGLAAFVLTESLGRSDESILAKGLGPGNTITNVDVGRGVFGLWISGPVHRLMVFEPAGSVRDAKTRDVGDVLVWVRNGTLFRIETTLGLDKALQVARSVP